MGMQTADVRPHAHACPLTPDLYPGWVNSILCFCNLFPGFLYLAFRSMERSLRHQIASATPSIQRGI